MSLPEITDRSRETPLDTFTVFPNLPSELQLKIWDWAVIGTPYQTPHVHHIFEHDATTAQVRRTSQLRRVFMTGGTARNLPLGYLNLIYPLEWSLGMGIAVYKSSRPIDPLLHTCSIIRKKILAVFEMVFAFGTYINFKHDILFIETSGRITNLESVTHNLPAKFPGLAIRYTMAQTIEEGRVHIAYGAAGPVTLVHQIYGADDKNTTDLVFINYEKFWGKPFNYRGTIAKVKEHVVAVPKAKIETLKGLKDRKEGESVFLQLQRISGKEVKEGDEKKLVNDFIRIL